MFFHMPTGGPGLGLRPPEITVPVILRESAGVSTGSVLMFDITNSDGDVSDNNLDGGNDSGFANVLLPNTTDWAGVETHGLCGVALSDASDNEELKVMIYGVTDVFVEAASGSVAAGDDLVLDVSVTADYALTNIVASGQVHKIYGIGLEAVTTPTTATVGSVFFNGMSGWGYVAG